MKIFAIELKITLLILIIVAAIIATGYLSYKNLSQIVQSVHREARPDYKLIKIKEITSDLSDVDNSVQLYSLTREPKYLKPYNRIISTVDKRIDELLSLQGNDTSQISNIHAIRDLIGEKLVVWDQILRLHSKPREKEVFEEFYSVIEKKTTDSVTPKKNNILKRFFKRKKEATLGKEEVQQEVAKLERSLSEVAVQQATTESQLLKRNNQLGSKLHFLILQLEQKETESLFVKSLEAEILAQQTYRWLAIFCVAAVVLLIIVLFIIINYSRKSSQSQRVLQQARVEAENLIKARELFTANVSHELRTPMNAIYGLSEQLLQEQVDSHIGEKLAVIKKSADYLNRIVNDILDFSKIEAGKLQLENIPFRPRVVFEEVCALNQIIAQQKNLEFRCNFTEKLPEQVSGDPTRLKQVMLNLLNNAFKFTETGYVSVSADASFSENSRALIAITVSDTGIGIPQEKLSTIFDDYTQAEQSTNRHYGGTGLGLSIVKRLVELMGGSVEVKSTPRQGTSFICTIPFEISNEVILSENEPGFAIPGDWKKVRVLVADDEEYNRMLLSTILKKWNLNFICVSNGKDAIQLALENYYDIILMDLRMPEMNGYEASKEILGFSPRSKIVALTAGNYYADIVQCNQLGMAGFLLKPFSEKELYLTMSKLLGNVETNSVSSSENEVSASFETNEIKLDELYRVSEGDGKFVDDMLGLFIKSTNEGLEQLKIHLQNCNWKDLSDTAHKMAPPCRHLGALGLYKNLKELEKMAGISPGEVPKVKNLVGLVEVQIDEITSTIEKKIA